MMGENQQTALDAKPSILPEFVLLPGVFDKALLEGNPVCQLALKELLRGLCENGLLSSVPKEQLHKAIAKRVLELPLGLKKDVEVALMQLDRQHRLVSRPLAGESPASNASEWMGCVLESDAQLPFECITFENGQLPGGLAGNPRYTCLDSVLDSGVYQALRNQTCEPMTQCETDYARVLEPMLRFAQRVDIVDPWLDPQKQEVQRFIELVSKLHYQKLDNLGGGTIRIHTTCIVKDQQAKYSVEEVLEHWENLLARLNGKYKHKYEVLIWGEYEGNKPHNRRILTNQHCGIKADLSFRILDNPPAEDNLWTLLSPVVSEREREKYAPKSQHFKLEGMRKVPSRKPNY